MTGRRRHDPNTFFLSLSSDLITKQSREYFGYGANLDRRDESHRGVQGMPYCVPRERVPHMKYRCQGRPQSEGISRSEGTIIGLLSSAVQGLESRRGGRASVSGMQEGMFGEGDRVHG